MTGGELAEALVARGLDASELTAKRSLFDLVLARFESLDGLEVPRSADKVHVWWVPGRLEVFCTHTD